MYPDTISTSAALSAKDWISGRNSLPLLISLKTGTDLKPKRKLKILFFYVKKLIEIICCFLGGSITTHKPRVYKPVQLVTATEMNNKKKFAFLSTETVPDYRPVEYNITDEKSQKTSSNQSTKFHQLQQKFGNIQVTDLFINFCTLQFCSF